MKRWKVIILSAVLAWCAVPAIALAAPVNVFEQACTANGVPTSGDVKNIPEACMVNKNPVTGPNSTIAKVTTLLAYITGVCTIIMMIVGGILYALSGGDPGKVSAAKNTIIYAAIGLVIVIVAQGIIIFILNKIVTPA